MKNFKNIFAALLALSIVFGVRAAAPSGYYSSAEGKSGKALLEQLCTIINSHTVISYKGLWEAFKTTDLKANGKIWDMYSTKEFSTTEQCGNYTAIGDCYNREHSFPKSWFNDASPMYSDLFHLYPTDGRVNNQRGNYPFGECANGERVPSKNGVNALGKKGTSTYPGYTGTVWEPDDEYKGDFARTYFYMAACYNNKIASWNSDMLAGNSYPAYTTWAINMLIKWHEQDPVSEKETKRNDAVYSLQKNRNPFIDYPELVDYIWGDKTSIGWTPGGVVSPKLVYPADGATLDMGVTLAGTPLNYTVTVKGTNLTKDLTVTLSGTGMSTTTTTVKAADANSANGASVVVTFTSATETSATGTIKVSSSEVSATATLKAQAISAVPALAATNVTFESFNANWQDVLADGSTYQLYVYDSAMHTLAGYPVNVAASLQTYKVTDLNANTKYFYNLKKGSSTSNTIEVTTADYPRSISAAPDSELFFKVRPNTDSEPIAVDIVTEYIDEDVTVTVTAPFQISSDKANWQTSLSVDKSGERIYVRIPASPIGEYTGTLSGSTSTVAGFDADVTASVTDVASFFEDFEQPNTGLSSYNASGNEYQGTACKWYVKGASIFPGDSSDRKNGEQSIRSYFGKVSSGNPSLLEMREDKVGGIGTVTFKAGLYGGDGASELSLYTSTDGGTSWTKAKDFTISDTFLSEYVASVGIKGNARIKFEHTSGKRCNIDDVTITDFTVPSGAVDQTLSEQWDAFARGGKIVVELQQPATISIYTLDARKVFEKTLTSGKEIEMPRGVYIVVCGDDNRKVIVK